jgi:hypothetical protein
MSTIAIPNGLLSEAGNLSSSADLFVTDLNQLAQNLQVNNVPAAEEDYITLSEDALSGIIATAAQTDTIGLATTVLAEISSSSLSQQVK